MYISELPIILLLSSKIPANQTPSTQQAAPAIGSAWISSCVPDTFSKRTREGIEKGVVTRGQRIEITEVIAYRLLAYTEYPTSAEYNGVCQALIANYPTLKDTIGNGYVSSCIIVTYNSKLHIQGSWKIQLRNKFKNMRRTHTPSSSPSQSKEVRTIATQFD